jgi:hypothetical protein
MKMKIQLYFFIVSEINKYKASKIICSEYITFSIIMISIFISEGILEYVKFDKSIFSVFSI